MILTKKQKAVILLSRTPGVGRVKSKKILERLAGKEEILAEDISSVRNFLLTNDGIGEKEYSALCRTACDFDFCAWEKEMTAKGIEIVTYIDAEYPRTLRVYEDMPLVLYAKGNLTLLNRPCFAVVGTRYPTKYGIRVTEDFVTGLSERFCIVSGMARGVDSVAHETCLKSFGNTIAVLGCGVDVVYPPENKGLYDMIADRGLIISEQEPGEPAQSYNFPQRNRIISGLGRAVLVTEAGEKSGTLLTVNHAIEQGKDIFCVPNSIYNKQGVGCNRAIRDCQTRMVMDVNDIYNELGEKKTELRKPSALQLDVNQEALLSALTEHGEMHFEELLQLVDLSVPQLNVLLVKMESVGLITKTKHNYWSV